MVLVTGLRKNFPGQIVLRLRTADSVRGCMWFCIDLLLNATYTLIFYTALLLLGIRAIFNTFQFSSDVAVVLLNVVDAFAVADLGYFC